MDWIHRIYRENKLIAEVMLTDNYDINIEIFSCNDKRTSITNDEIKTINSHRITFENFISDQLRKLNKPLVSFNNIRIWNDTKCKNRVDISKINGNNNNLTIIGNKNKIITPFHLEHVDIISDEIEHDILTSNIYTSVSSDISIIGNNIKGLNFKNINSNIISIAPKNVEDGCVVSLKDVNTENVKTLKIVNCRPTEYENADINFDGLECNGIGCEQTLIDKFINTKNERDKMWKRIKEIPLKKLKITNSSVFPFQNFIRTSDLKIDKDMDVEIVNGNIFQLRGLTPDEIKYFIENYNFRSNVLSSEQFIKYKKATEPIEHSYNQCLNGINEGCTELHNITKEINFDQIHTMLKTIPMNTEEIHPLIVEMNIEPKDIEKLDYLLRVGDIPEQNQPFVKELINSKQLKIVTTKDFNILL